MLSVSFSSSPIISLLVFFTFFLILFNSSRPSSFTQKAWPLTKHTLYVRTYLSRMIGECLYIYIYSYIYFRSDKKDCLRNFCTTRSLFIYVTHNLLPYYSLPFYRSVRAPFVRMRTCEYVCTIACACTCVRIRFTISLPSKSSDRPHQWGCSQFLLLEV